MVDNLQHETSALSMHRIGDEPPAGDLFRAVDAGHIRIAVALNADRCGFGDIQAGGRALAVIFGVQGGRNAPRTGAHAGQRRHDDPVGKGKSAELEWLEEDVGGHELILS